MVMAQWESLLLTELKKLWLGQSLQLLAIYLDVAVVEDIVYLYVKRTITMLLSIMLKP